jgi:hypothetical protein
LRGESRKFDPLDWFAGANIEVVPIIDVTLLVHGLCSIETSVSENGSNTLLAFKFQACKWGDDVETREAQIREVFGQPFTFRNWGQKVSLVRILKIKIVHVREWVIIGIRAVEAK